MHALLRDLIGVLFLFVMAIAICGCKSSGSDKIPELPGLNLSISAGSPGDQNIAANATVVACHIHLETPGTENVSIASVALTAFGDGDDFIDISSVEIYLDVNDNDAYDSGTDSIIGSGTFNANNGKAVITFGSAQVISPGTGRNWIVIYKLNGNGPDGATYSFSILSSADVDVDYFSGIPTSASGLPLASAVLTITSGGARLNLLQGPNLPPDTEVLKSTINVPILQFSLYNRDADDITVTSIRVTPSGSGNDATEISSASIYIDTNGDGLHTGGEPLFGSFTYSSDNTATDVSGSLTISTGNRVHFLVTYDFDTTAVIGSTFRGEIAAANHIQAEDSVPVAVVPVGSTPLQGALITIAEKGTLSAQAGANNPTGGTAMAGTINLPVLQIALTAGALEDVAVDSISIHATGTADDSLDFTQVALYRDANGDGDVDGSDTLLGSGQFGADDGILVLSSAGLTVSAGLSANVLVTYDIASTAQMEATFSAYILDSSEIIATGVISGLGITPSGTFPINGPSFEIRIPDTFVDTGNLSVKRFMHTQTTFTDPADGKAKVLVCGGYDGTSVLSSAEVYDPELEVWTSLASPMAKSRMLHTATLLGDGQRIVIAGGSDGVQTHQDGELFDPTTYTFTAITDIMTSRRQMHTAVLTDQDDVFYFAGQYLLGAPVYVKTTEIYDDTVNRFDPVGTSIYVRILHTFNKLTGGTVIATGGLGYSTSGPSSTVLLKSVQTWSTSPIITESLSWLSLAGYGRCGHVAVSLPGGELLIAGGYSINLNMYTTPPFSGRKTAELIKENAAFLGDESIEDVGDMAEVRFMPVAQLLPNGEVLIAGGTDDTMAALAVDTAELYDPSSKTFSNCNGTMNLARYRATSSMLPGPDGLLGTSDDTVLIVGGLVEYAPSPGPVQITDSVEVYYP